MNRYNCQSQPARKHQTYSSCVVLWIISSITRQKYYLLLYLVYPQGGGGGGYYDIFIHTKARVIFLGFKILNFIIFGGFQKNEYFLRYEDFVDIFWGHHKIGLYLGVISMHLRLNSYG